LFDCGAGQKIKGKGLKKCPWPVPPKRLPCDDRPGRDQRRLIADMMGEDAAVLRRNRPCRLPPPLVGFRVGDHSNAQAVPHDVHVDSDRPICHVH